MTRHHATWLATASIFALAFSATPNLAHAADPAKAGATMTLNILITSKEHGKTDIKTTTIEHSLKGQCLMQAQQPQTIGMDGTSAQQQQELANSQAKSQALAQQYAPSEDLQNQIAAEAEKCGDDQACMMAIVQKLSQNPEIQKMSKNVDAVKAGMAEATPNLGPARYQLWQSTQCSGTITANDRTDIDDPGYEGGMDAYKETIKTQGAAPAGTSWVMFAETDLVAGTTTYRIGTPPSVMIPTTSTRKGASQQQVNVILSTKAPEKIGPLKGVFGKQSTTIRGPSGTLDFTWQSGH